MRQRLVLTPVGDLDLVSSPQLERAFRLAMIRGHRRIVLDLRNVSFADCAFLHVVVAAYERLYRRGGSLSIVNAHGTTARVLRFAGLPFSVRPTDATACGHGGRPEPAER